MLDVRHTAETIGAEERQKRESKYVMKTGKINKYKTLKANKMSEIAEKNRKEFEEKKQRHAEGLNRMTVESNMRQDMYRQILEQKQFRKRDILAMRVNIEISD